MKKYLTDNFGYTLRNIRETLGLTQTEVFQGILARSTWYAYEVEEIVPDMVTFITLLERMGVSSDRFEFIVPKEVHKFYSWYEECQNCIEAKDWESLIRKREEFKILKQINIKIQYQYRDFVDYVIERYANGNLDKALFHIKKALLNTICDIDNVVAGRLLLSIFEGHLLANYYDLIYNIGKENAENITKRLYSFYNYYKCRLKDDMIREKILPRIAIVMLKYDRAVFNDEDRLRIEYESLQILIKNTLIREVPEILKLMIEDEKAYYMKVARKMHRDAILSVFERYKISPDFRVELQRSARKKYLILGDVLKFRRKEMGLTIEETAGNICSVSTYARAESGKVTPKKATLEKLKERLKLGALHYSTEVETEEYYTLILNSECRRLISLRKHQVAEKKCKELSEKIDINIPVNKQIIEFYRLYKSLGERGSVNKLWNILSYTVENFDKRLLFSREELELLSCIAREKAKNSGKEGIMLLAELLEKENKKSKTYYRRTAIINRDLIKMLKDSEEYSKSYELANKTIDRMFEENETGLLLDVLDYMSTINEEIGNKAKADKICKIMFYIAELYEMYDDAKSIKNYYEINFNKNEIWY